MGGNKQNSQYWGSRCLTGKSTDASSGCGAEGYGLHNTPTGQGDAWEGQHQSATQWADASSQRYVQPKPIYDSGKNRIVAGLLAIFLGGFGIHKFYLGYNSVGFIMLGVTILGSIFTLGLAGMVMWVIGVVEGIIYLSKDQETFDRTYAYNMKEWF